MAKTNDFAFTACKRLSAKKKFPATDILRYLFLTLLCFFFLFPIFVMLMKSFMSDNEVLFEVLVFPRNISLAAYTRVFNIKMIRWMGNTVLIFLINAFGITASASLCAFGFSKLRFKGRNFCFMLVLATMMLPAISMQIPLFSLYTKMRWVGTWLPMTVPAYFGGGAGTIFLMRQFMRNIPDQYNEAARIDGANKFVIYFYIVMPLCMPITVLTVVNCFIGTWNDFQNPLMYLGTQEGKYTISLGLYYTYKATSNPQNYPNVQMAAGIFMTVPCVILFFLFQRTLISGITVGGIKG